MIQFRLPPESLKLFRNLKDFCERIRIARQGLIDLDFKYGFELGDRAKPVFVSYLYFLAQRIDDRRCEVFSTLRPSLRITGLPGLNWRLTGGRPYPTGLL